MACHASSGEHSALGRHVRVAGWLVVAFGLAVNLLLQLLPGWPPGDAGLRNTWWFVSLQGRGQDSWQPMREALDHLAGRQEAGLYEAVFFERGTKFQYPPSSLLALALLAWIGPVDLARPEVGPLRNPWFHYPILNLTGWLAVLLTLVLCVGVLDQAFRRYRPEWVLQRTAGQERRLLVLVVLAGACFNPLVRAYALGQAQTWITLLFAAALLGYLRALNLQAGPAGGATGVTDGEARGASRARGWMVFSGACCGAVVAIKPHYGLILLWAAFRRRWSFCVGMGGSLLMLGVMSILVFGWACHAEYLQALGHMARHGETYHLNHSVGGVLARLWTDGEVWRFQARSFAPHDGRVELAARVWMVLACALALLWPWLQGGCRGRTGRQARAGRVGGVDPLLDLCIAMLLATLASPIVWDHHYGAVFPILLCLWPAIAARSDRAVRRLSLGMLMLVYALCTPIWRPAPLLLEFGAIGVLAHPYLLWAGMVLIGLLMWVGGVSNASAHPAKR